MVKHKTLFLKVDQSSPLPINIQLKEQIKWLIITNDIKPRDMLPPVNQLAEQLNVNRNTINFVYSHLRDEGIVLMQKGRGTQVAEGTKINELKKKEPLFSFVEQTIKKAVEMGFHPEDTAKACFTYVQLFSNPTIKHPRILFVECREHDYHFYKKEIEHYTGAEIESLFLEDIHSYGSQLEEVLRNVDLIVTTLNHVDEVRGLIDNQKVVLTIGATADISVLLEIAKLEANSKVGFVCLGKKGGQWMAQRVKDAGIQHIVNMAEGINDKQNLNDLLSQADYIYASSAVYNEVKELSPKKVYLYPLRLEKGSEKMLTDFRDTFNSSNGTQ
jgi:GntR family transcriptional regulator